MNVYKHSHSLNKIIGIMLYKTIRQEYLILKKSLKHDGSDYIVFILTILNLTIPLLKAQIPSSINSINTIKIFLYVNPLIIVLG